MNVGNIAMWVYRLLAGSETMYLLFKEQKQKEIVNRFLGPSCYNMPNYQREILES